MNNKSIGVIVFVVLVAGFVGGRYAGESSAFEDLKGKIDMLTMQRDQALKKFADCNGGESSRMLEAVSSLGDGDQSLWRDISATDRRFWNSMTRPEKAMFTFGWLCGFRHVALAANLGPKKTTCGVLDVVGVVDVSYSKPGTDGVRLDYLISESFWYEKEGP